jgi:hypothetical protein
MTVHNITFLMKQANTLCLGNKPCLQYSPGIRGGTVGLGTELQAARSRVRFPIVTLEFVIDTGRPGPGVDSASKRN